MPGTLIAIVFLSILSIGLFLSLFLLRREIDSVRNQLWEASTGVEKPVTIAFIDCRLTELAAEINKNQALQKENKQSIIKREQSLKDSVSNISHDLRTPLTSLTGYLQLLQKTELTDEQKDYVDIALSRGRYLQTLISDFYDISVLESPNQIPDLTKINLYKIMSEIVLSFTKQLEEKNITPIVLFPGTPVYVMADGTMLKRVITNLIANAIHYGTKELKIEVSDKELFEIRFQNEVGQDGIQDSSRLFEKFYTADSARNQSGSGLGLYIVKMLAEKMGGNVSAAFQDNKLTVSLFLRKA